MGLTTEDGKPCEGVDQGPFEPIAVIGLGALMPDAHDIEAFWQNILDAKVSIRTLPDGRWPGPIDHFWKEGGECLRPFGNLCLILRTRSKLWRNTEAGWRNRGPGLVMRAMPLMGQQAHLERKETSTAGRGAAKGITRHRYHL